jgi:hypothetical protein
MTIVVFLIFLSVLLIAIGLLGLVPRGAGKPLVIVPALPLIVVGIICLFAVLLLGDHAVVVR